MYWFCASVHAKVECDTAELKRESGVGLLTRSLDVVVDEDFIGKLVERCGVLVVRAEKRGVSIKHQVSLVVVRAFYHTKSNLF